MSAPLRLQFVTSAPRIDQLPDTRAEVAVVGRSNVGKSSLLNALANRKNLAQTSKSPGRTRLLNVFALDDGTALVDCPGYGYASAPKAVQAKWQQMMERYLVEREQLDMIMVLIDGEIGPTKLDRQMLDWLRSHGLPHTVIATKADKVKASVRGKRQRELAERCDLDPGDVVWVSATKGSGLDPLRDLVRTWLS
ncbi:MAG: ribosome biogenesis GTP-binding protein YihA/YsxC [Acidimicrobiales bacterium]|nr:ribosome biogenesis GTP-binding protein YihA/YsxC [Acidimicrobiales bacterium]